MVAREQGFNLKDAVEHYAAHLESLNHSASIETAIEEFLSIREAEGKAKAHLVDLRHRLNRFAHAFGTRLAASITTKELDGWLHGLIVAPQTRTNYRRVVHNFFSFCTTRGYCTGNPVAQASQGQGAAKGDWHSQLWTRRVFCSPRVRMRSGQQWPSACSLA